jgi:hypothetical protein
MQIGAQALSKGVVQLAAEAPKKAAALAAHQTAICEARLGRRALGPIRLIGQDIERGALPPGIGKRRR